MGVAGCLVLGAATGWNEGMAFGQAGDEESAQNATDVAEEETVPAGEGTPIGAPQTHSVRSGDTLWNISERYFKDPWRWPKIWALNPEIANPHWIFPGQVLRLRDDKRVAAAQEGEAPSLPPLPAKPPAVSAHDGAGRLALSDSPDIRQLGFIDEGNLKAAGVINGSLEEKIMLASGDHVYVEFPKDHPPKGGARYSIYQIDADHPLRDPGSSLILGYLVHIYGDVVIDEFTDRPIANARLLDVVEPIERGYRVGPLMGQLKSVSTKKNEASLTARIVAAVQPNIMIAKQMFVVLNRGRRHGVDVGNRFQVLRQGDGIKRVMEDWDTLDHRFPPHAIAEIVTVDVQNESSIGWVSRSSRELRIGDVADLRAGY